MFRPIRGCLLLACLCVAPGIAGAQITAYTARPAWTAAIGAPEFFLDFNDIALDIPLSTVPVGFGPFEIIADGGASLVDAPPFVNSDPSFDNTTHLHFYVEGFGTPIQATVVFDPPVFSFGGDFDYAGNSGSPLEMDVVMAKETQTLQVSASGLDHQFYGFVSTKPVSRVVFHNSINDGFFLDNVGGTKRDTTPNQVATWGTLKWRYSH
jgi:hypothetical protein